MSSTLSRISTRLIRAVCAFVVSLLLAGFLGTGLICLAPGLGTDERELDGRLNEDSIKAIRSEGDSGRNVFGVYGRYLKGIATGDLGVSRSLNRPVKELLTERLPATAKLAGFGLAAGWTLALVVAASTVVIRNSAFRLLASASGGLLLCAPSALLTFALMLAKVPAALGIAAVVFPRVFRYLASLLQASEAAPFVLAARARGVSRIRLLATEIVPATLPGLIAVTGAAFNIAIGACIPIEVLCDQPGMGQLAWKAALSRDLPLLINVTLAVSAMTLLANRTSDFLIEVLGRNA